MPSPWFPALAVMTRWPAGRRSRAASAPRTLNEPVGCIVSSFSHASVPSGLATRGVGARRADTVAHASSRSASVGALTWRMFVMVCAYSAAVVP